MTIPKIWELPDLAAEAIRAIALVQAAETKIRDSAIPDPDYEDGFSCVVVDDGTKAKIIADRLRMIGFCIVILPVASGNPRAQSGPATIFDCLVVVEVKVNVEQNAHETRGAGVIAIEATASVIAALCRKERHPGGEFFKAHEDGFTRSSFDEGELSYIAAFTKEAVL